MFTKILSQNLSYVIDTKAIFSQKRDLLMFSVAVRGFIFCRFHPSDMALIETKDNYIKLHHMQKLQTADLSSSKSFLQFGGNSQAKNKTYQGKKLVGYSAEHMFDVVADVEKYETFLPFCKKSHVTFKSSTNIKADLVIGFPPLVESYTSNVSLVKPQLIKAVCTEGKLFNYLLTTWKFSPGLKNNPNTCIIDFFVSFEFRSALHSHLANLFFNELVRQMESAFYQEARHRYGKPTVSMQSLSVLHQNS